MKTLKYLLGMSGAMALLLSSCSMDKQVASSSLKLDYQNYKQLPAAQATVATNASQAVTNENAVAATAPAAEKSVVFTASTAKAAPASKKASFENTRASLKTHASVKKNQGKSVKTVAEQKRDIQKVQADKSTKKALKNQIVAALLCFFLGMLGVHRFYLGYTGIGIIQLAMFIVGLVLSLILIGYFILLALWIWVLIDFVRILIGNLEPKDGSYD